MEDANVLEIEYRKRISELVDEAYKNSGITVEPLYPKVLVKVLPRAQVTASGLYLPGKQNKILIEGVVLATYKPFWTIYKKDGEHDVTRVEIKASVEVGDHVIWQHYEGAPVTPLTDEYRLVKEDVLQGRLDYEAKNATEQWLFDTMNDEPDPVHALLDDAYVIRKDMHCLTTSGV